jgi:hypothetical protein
VEDRILAELLLRGVGVVEQGNAKQPGKTRLGDAAVQQQKTSEDDRPYDHPGFPPPKVVILAGPHKTGSTSLQVCMVDWTNNYRQAERQKQQRQQQQETLQRNNRQRKQRGRSPLPPPATPTSDLILPNWSWPAPHEQTLETANALHTNTEKAHTNAEKAFSALLKGPHQPQIYNLFRQAMAQAWNGTWSNKIVYGSEIFDYILHLDNYGRKTKVQWEKEAMERILGVLPTTPTNSTTIVTPPPPPQDIEVVIVYRSPRIYHLRSLWHQIRGNETFTEFLTTAVSPNSRSLPRYAHVLDPLGLAHQFLKLPQSHTLHTIRTTIIDLSGLPTNTGGTNLCHVVACEIMRDVECTDDHRIVSLIDNDDDTNNSSTKPKRHDISQQSFNKRSRDGEVEGGGHGSQVKVDRQYDPSMTNEQWTAIDTVMNEYDCSWQHTVEVYAATSTTGRSDSHTSFRILHQQDVFSTCRSASSTQEQQQPRTLSWMVDEIQSILRP